MKRTISLVVLLALLLSVQSCMDIPATAQPESNSGVKQTSVQVQKDDKGLTIEQENVKNRLIEDNKPGAVKHFYLISAYSGQVILYSTVKGKVTSSGKRLSPTSVATNVPNDITARDGVPVDIGGDNYRTGEVLQDDGTYGSSVEYIYFWDTQGNYRQIYVTGGTIPIVSSQPLAVHGITINMSLQPDK